MRFTFKALLSALVSLSVATILGSHRAEASILETHAHLKDYLFEEPKSNFYLGFGLTPVGLLRGRMLFAANFFQLHWLSGMWDLELLNASFGFTSTQQTTLQSNHFVFRTAPKVKLFKLISLGPVLGYEFVSFPEVKSRLFKNQFATPTEPFSSGGVIYGFMASETFTYKDDYLIKVNQLVFKQNYSTEKTLEEWYYLYDRADLRADKTPIEGDLVFMIEIALLF
jgi:hypothetical protein